MEKSSVKLNFPIVLIKWIDSCAATDGWTDLDKISFDVSLDCYTVGFLLDETADRITVAASIAMDKNGETADSVDLGLIIPKSAIKSIKKIGGKIGRNKL